MPSDLTCPHCATPLPSGQADAAEQTTACPRCAAGAAPTPPASQPVPAEVPWWVGSPPVPFPGETGPGAPPRDETPWWVAPPPTLPTEAPALAHAPAAVAPLPGVGKGGVVIRAYLVAAGVLLAVGMGVGILYLSADEAAQSSVAWAPPAGPPSAPVAPPVPVETPEVADAKKSTPSAGERLPPPAPDDEAGSARSPEAPEKIAGPAGDPSTPAERPDRPGKGDAGASVAAQGGGPAELPEGAAPLLWRLASAKRVERLQGAALLGRYGTAAKAAAPTLDYTMRADPDAAVANEAAASLARIGPAGVPYLTAALRHGSPTVRQRAASALAAVGPEARAATAELLRALKDDSPAVRAVAAHALGEVGGHPRRLVPALCEALGDTAEVRKQAGLALVALGEDAVPALREALKSPSAARRREAALVLGSMGSDARAAAGDLALLLQDAQPSVRGAAAGALAGMGKDAQDAIPALLRTLRQETRFEVQQQLFQALTLIGSRDLPGFLKAVREVDREGRWATPYRLGQFGPNPEDAVKPLIQMVLKDPDPGKRMAAAIALGKLGLLSDQSVPALTRAMDDPSPQVKAAASVSLARLAPGHERVAQLKLTAAMDNMARLIDRLKQVVVGMQQRQLALGTGADPNRMLVELMRPLNRAAVTDRRLQAHYNEVIDLHLLAVTPECPQHKLWQQAAGVKGFVLEASASALVDCLPMEAAPAIVRGINQAAAFELGFC
jgi:HEAT repeat protein